VRTQVYESEVIRSPTDNCRRRLAHSRCGQLAAADRAWPIAQTGSVLCALEVPYFRAILQSFGNTVTAPPRQFRLYKDSCVNTDL